LAKLYGVLGPFDFSKYKEDPSLFDLDENSDGGVEDRRYPQEEFVQRRSGAMYRGDVLQENERPDGMGFKVHDGKSLYEGYFFDGQCHGIGRGISKRGELYQGGFSEDMMEGEGFFLWPDGRIYEGGWVHNKKQGKGTYFWPNG